MDIKENGTIEDLTSKPLLAERMVIKVLGAFDSRI